ncbi:MAG: LacI family DNA-binding transcriptional regulator [Tepidisphaeraceae bacterium]
MNRPGGTLKDIATALNLSSGTVSRVLNGRGDLAQETREKVFGLAAELNYLPRRKNMSPKPGVTRLALCIGNPCSATDGQLDPSYVGFHFLSAIQTAAAKAGIGVMVSFVDAADPDAEIESLPMFRREEAQGIILAYPFPERVVERLARIAPVVSLEHVYPGVSLDVVGPTHALDAMAAVDHLVRLGHREIAYIGDEGAQGHKLTQGLRHAGYVSGLERCGIPYRQSRVLNVHDKSVSKQDLPGAVGRWVRDGVTAVVCSIDRHAYLLWDTLPATGIRVPQDVSLVGIGGIHRVAGQPQLTTWRCDYAGLADAAIEALQSRFRQSGNADLYREIRSTFVPGHTVAMAQI